MKFFCNFTECLYINISKFSQINPIDRFGECIVSIKVYSSSISINLMDQQRISNCFQECFIDYVMSKGIADGISIAESVHIVTRFKNVLAYLEF